MKKLISPLLILTLVGCENPEIKSNIGEAKKALIGTWYGSNRSDKDDSESDWHVHWKTERHQDGSYTVTSVTVSKNKKTYTLFEETGSWEYTEEYYIETPNAGDQRKYLTVSLTKDSYSSSYYEPELEFEADILTESTDKPSDFSLTPPSGYENVTESDE